MSLFERDAHRISKLFETSAKTEFDRDFFGNVEAMGAVRLVNVKSKLFRRDDDLNIFEYLYTLCELVTELPLFEAENGHDLIYAVLSLAKDTEGRIKAKAESDTEANTNTNAGGLTNLEASNNADGPTNLEASNNADSPSNLEASNNVDGPTNMEASISSLKSVDSFKSAPSRNPSIYSFDALKPDVTKSRRPSILITEADLAYPRKEALKRGVVNRWRQNTKKREFIVDYKQPFYNVCRQFLDFAFRDAAGNNNLDILCRP